MGKDNELPRWAAELILYLQRMACTLAESEVATLRAVVRDGVLYQVYVESRYERGHGKEMFFGKDGS